MTTMRTPQDRGTQPVLGRECRHLVRRNVFHTPLAERVSGRVLTPNEFNLGTQLIALNLSRLPPYPNAGNAGVHLEKSLQLYRIHLPSTDIQHSLPEAGQSDTAMLVNPPIVSRMQPPVSERSISRFLRSVVAR